MYCLEFGNILSSPFDLNSCSVLVYRYLMPWTSFRSCRICNWTLGTNSWCVGRFNEELNNSICNSSAAWTAIFAVPQKFFLGVKVSSCSRIDLHYLLQALLHCCFISYYWPAAGSTSFFCTVISVRPLSNQMLVFGSIILNIQKPCLGVITDRC